MSRGYSSNHSKQLELQRPCSRFLRDVSDAFQRNVAGHARGKVVGTVSGRRDTEVSLAAFAGFTANSG